VALWVAALDWGLLRHCFYHLRFPRIRLLLYVRNTFTVRYSTLLIVAKEVSICSIIYLNNNHYGDIHVCIIRSQCDNPPQYCNNSLDILDMDLYYAK